MILCNFKVNINKIQSKDMTTPPLTPPNAIPAIACSLGGAYLIEASAGTGKTWTLTGILLRLLVEKKYPPERIIATTFTRDSAQEIQERLQSRLQEFYHYLQWVISHRTSCPKWFLVGFGHHIDEVMSELVSEATKAGVVSCDDPIHDHLIRHLLSDVDTSALDRALHQLSLLLATLDRLFVGTLDSLAQKLLKEFAGEISYHANTTLISDTQAKQQLHSLIHDELRREHHRMAHLPHLSKFISAELFGDVSSVLEVVNKTLQFYQADIDEAIDIDELLGKFDEFIDEILAIDWSVFSPYCQIDSAKQLGFSGSLKLTKQFYHLPNIIQKIKQNRQGFYDDLSKEEKDWLNEFDGATFFNKKIFNKGFDEQKNLFFQLPVQSLISLNQWICQLDRLGEIYARQLYRRIALSIRHKFKAQLESEQQSTFAFQMVRLNEALAKNESLCRHIRHLYPVALIDESQDINGSQADLLRHLYLDAMLKERNKQKPIKGFLLLVGDPKQAIYHFRGGDVSNYNFVKNYGKTPNQPPLLNQSLSLTENRRSHQGLIDSLNEWFLDNGKSHHDNPANLGANIFYQHIKAVNDKPTLSWQQNTHQNDYLGQCAVSVLHIDNENKSKTIECVALHINSLLHHHQINDKNIIPSDIAILARTKDELANIKQALNKLNIPAISAQDVSIFTTQSAKDVHVLLKAMIEPNEQRIGRLLTCSLFDLSLDNAWQMIESGKQDYINIINYLKKAKDNWHRYGVMSGLYYALLNNPLENLPNQSPDLWQQCAKHGERYLADLWQLIEIIGGESRKQHHRHELHLLAWYDDMMNNKNDEERYKRQPLPSESGVNLLTIHKSKGLQFNIVYVFQLDDPLKGKNNAIEFYPYSTDDFVRHISPNKNKQSTYINEQIDESRRLGYVALTRACEQLFVVARDAYKSISKASLKEIPLFLWFDIQKDEIKLNLPDRLKNHVDWIELMDCKLIDTPYQPIISTNKKINHESWSSIFVSSKFLGKHSTSASDLMSRLDKSEFIQEKEDGQEMPLILTNWDNTSPNMMYDTQDIRRDFGRGKDSGTFLHELLQIIQPDNDKQISDSINHCVNKLNFSKHYLSTQNDPTAHEQLIAWLKLITHTPMSSGISLSELINHSSDNPRCIREMGFSLGLAQSFNINSLNDILSQYHDKFINPIDDDELLYDCLNGEMDLVYEHHGKFYVVDYKSNFISQELFHYEKNMLNDVMIKSGYWLQACIYQVALHRLLSLRIADYIGNEQHYLGGVEFIFLRGVDSRDTSWGRITWQPPMTLIFALDELFGLNHKGV